MSSRDRDRGGERVTVVELTESEITLLRTLLLDIQTGKLVVSLVWKLLAGIGAVVLFVVTQFDHILLFFQWLRGDSR